MYSLRPCMFVGYAKCDVAYRHLAVKNNYSAYLKAYEFFFNLRPTKIHGWGTARSRNN
jgi:hypothetical protein